MERDEQVGRMILEAMAGMHGNMARDIAQAWCSVVEQKQSLLQHIDQIEKENSSLKKDAARLDWIDKVGEVHICRVREGSVSGNLRWDVEYGYYGGLAKSKKGMRQAIDTAMQKD